MGEESTNMDTYSVEEQLKSINDKLSIVLEDYRLTKKQLTAIELDMAILARLEDCPKLGYKISDAARKIDSLIEKSFNYSQITWAIKQDEIRKNDNNRIPKSEVHRFLLLKYQDSLSIENFGTKIGVGNHAHTTPKSIKSKV